MKFNIKSKFSVKTGILALLGLFMVFIFVYNIGNVVEGMESSEKKDDKKIKESMEGGDKPKEESKVDKETLKFIVDKMLQ
jgi:hypothetical protein